MRWNAPRVCMCTRKCVQDFTGFCFYSVFILQLSCDIILSVCIIIVYLVINESYILDIRASRSVICN